MTTGRPSTTKRCIRSSTPAIGSTLVIGSPSSQWASSGQARTTRSKQSSWRSAFSGASPVTLKTVTDQVSLSPSRVTTETLPSGMSAGTHLDGPSGPVK